MRFVISLIGLTTSPIRFASSVKPDIDFGVINCISAALKPLGRVVVGSFDLTDSARNLLRTGNDAFNILASFSSAIS